MSCSLTIILILLTSAPGYETYLVILWSDHHSLCYPSFSIVWKIIQAQPVSTPAEKVPQKRSIDLRCFASVRSCWLLFTCQSLMAKETSSRVPFIVNTDNGLETLITFTQLERKCFERPLRIIWMSPPLSCSSLFSKFYFVFQFFNSTLHLPFKYPNS